MAKELHGELQVGGGVQTPAGALPPAVSSQADLEGEGNRVPPLKLTCKTEQN